MKSKLVRLAMLIFIVNLGLISVTVSDSTVPFTIGQPVTAARVTARTMWARLTGVIPPLDFAALDQMEALITAGDRFDAAKVATADDNFYNIVIRNMAAPMSTRTFQVNVPLNDFIATFIGNVRDHLNAKELLTGNYFYMADTSLISSSTPVPSDLVRDILASDNHYMALDTFGINLRQTLKQMPQYIYSRSGDAVLHPETAGLLTTRAWGAAHFRAGTNRRAVKETFHQFLCRDISEFADATGPNDFIAKDVTRTPQGDSSIFLNKCVSCHTMLDYMRPAFAHYDYIDLDNTYVRSVQMMDPNYDLTRMSTLQPNQMFIYQPTGLATKYYSNQQVYPQGHDLQDTNWYNNATSGTNAAFFGWRGATSGNGLQAFAAMIANSRAFTNCMVSRAFQQVCNRTPDPVNDAALTQALGDNFEQNNYRIIGLFEQLAARPECLGN